MKTYIENGVTGHVDYCHTEEKEVENSMKHMFEASDNEPEKVKVEAKSKELEEEMSLMFNSNIESDDEE